MKPCCIYIFLIVLMSATLLPVRVYPASARNTAASDKASAVTGHPDTGSPESGIDLLIEETFGQASSSVSIQDSIQSRKPAPDIPPGKEINTPQIATNSLGMTFNLIPAGTFMMGSPENETSRSADEPLHHVNIPRGFYMQTAEVTQGQWHQVMGTNPSEFRECGADCPVECVSWEDVGVFIARLNHMERTTAYRLPTEAEWEYACRAGTQTAFHWGNLPDCSRANYGGHEWMMECLGTTSASPMPAGAYPPNAVGLFDMHGNVWEWCSDVYNRHAYNKLGTSDSAFGPFGTDRVIRGGSWRGVSTICRSAFRNSAPPNTRSFDIGFRLCKTTQIPVSNPRPYITGDP